MFDGSIGAGSSVHASWRKYQIQRRRRDGKSSGTEWYNGQRIHDELWI